MQILASVVMLLAGCATGYQPKGLTGGYSETRLGERAFEVSFEGNGYTNQLAARRGAMHRAAELAVQLGYFGFWVASQNASVATSVYSQPVSCVSGNCSGGDATMIQKPTATITVTMVTWPEAQQPPPGMVVYDARQEITREWWDGRQTFDLYVSQLVLDEAAAGDPDASSRRLVALRDAAILDTTDEAIALGRHLVAAGGLPTKAAADALHIAIAAVHGLDYLLTWNCTHIANARTRGKIEGLCREAGYDPPMLCTPMELMGE